MHVAKNSISDHLLQIHSGHLMYRNESIHLDIFITDLIINNASV